MLSFMVVSAVSFAIFMRQGRAPSSYLRRNSTARYLLKAALANAIDRLDDGIGDDPYPGVGTRSASADKWLARVFCPSAEVTDPENTVSTLTLEGLAYLPPAIINEVRVYSRRTKTARWSNLAYDAGRYAFCAVNVSDCFDINRLSASERRLSSAGDRITLTSLFQNNADDLQKILDKCSNHEGGNNIPFVSIADFNVVAGNMGEEAADFAPFYKYIGTSGTAIYRTADATSISNALFITDTWFPPTNTTSVVKRFNLEDGDQPFASFTDSANFLTPAKSQTDLCKVLMKNIGGVGLACLYDYLDKDSRPISFVVPTVETVPMVVGIGLAHNSKFTPEAGIDSTATVTMSTPGQSPYTPTCDQYVWKAEKYTLKKLMNSMILTGVAAFPFKRAAAGKKDFKGSFKGEALIRVFFGPKTMKSRLDAESPLYPSKTGDWETGYKEGLVTIKCPISSISFSSDVLKTSDAAKQFTAQVTPPTVNAPLFWYVTEEEWASDGSVARRACGTPYYCLNGICNDPNAFVPRDGDGKVASWWTTAAGTAQTTAPDPAGAKPQPAVTLGTDEYVPHVLVWVRIVNDAQETVDIVPARIEDDGLWGASAFNAQGMASKFGDGTPVLEFRGDATRAFKYDTTIATKLDGQAETFPEWTQIYAVDPRYNHAPENWFAMTGNGDAKPEEWLKAIGADQSTASGLIGTAGRDRDIFMFTSDQEELQSIGELAFLPNVQEMNGSGDFFENDYLSISYNGSDFTGRIVGDGATLSTSDASKFACNEFMWRTYTAFDHGDGCDPIYSMADGSTPIEVLAGENDFRVNPFSPDDRVLMAALKDTPFDYCVASGNDERNKTFSKKPSDRASFAFCKGSSVARLDDDELLDIANAIRAKFGSWGNADWEAAFRSLDWSGVNCNDNQKSFLGVDDLQDPLHGVDRKYLYSFWRECFQNRQQLFLVFIRAEPLTVGGMGEGSLAASQLGARGVALVWRDPQPPSNANATSDSSSESSSTKNEPPHRTRVLFYHQFD